jgi:hypothetical protein
MKIFCKFLLALFFLLEGAHTAYAQVNINLPTTSIFNRSEFTTVQNVMYANSNGKFSNTDPSIKSSSVNFFSHTSLNSVFLPTSVLQWQLAGIGGEIPTFSNKDILPGYQSFTSSNQPWYNPHPSSRYRAGNVAFSFRIPSSEIQANAFYAGNYKIEVTQNYSQDFTPENFNIFISVPEDIRWLTSSNTKYVTVNSLNQFRSSGSQFQINLDPIEVGHTLPFNLFAKSDKKEVQFKSLNGKDRKFNVSVVKLGGTNSKLNTLPLGISWKNHSTSGGFTVEPGNRSNLNLQLSIMGEDFKNFFFEAGTYTFQVDLEARSTNGSKDLDQEIDVTIVVPILSEITIPGGNNEVNFNFNTMQHYNEGQSKSIPNQLRVSNNENYELYVKSNSNYFNSNGIQSNINASILEISIEGNSQKVTLSTNSQKLMSNGAPAIDKNLNINYTISPNAAQSLIPKEKKTYSINVVYSFTAL